MNYQLYHGDCLEVMKQLPDKSIDLILCDLPYGTTACKWDVIIPFDLLWEQYKRIIKDNGATVLFGSQPFASLLICSNLKLFKYEIIWDKVATTSGALATKQPIKKHENILVFYKKQPTYNPQMEEGTQWRRAGKNKKTPVIYGEIKEMGKPQNDTTNLKYPKSIKILSNANRLNRLHPTQKPVCLCEYLIKTYTNQGETVLDNCMGSGSTGIAALNTARFFIGIEKDDKYFEIAEKRMGEFEKWQKQ